MFQFLLCIFGAMKFWLKLLIRRLFFSSKISILAEFIPSFFGYTWLNFSSESIFNLLVGLVFLERWLVISFIWILFDLFSYWVFLEIYIVSCWINVISSVGGEKFEYVAEPKYASMFLFLETLLLLFLDYPEILIEYLLPGLLVLFLKLLLS